MPVELNPSSGWLDSPFECPRQQLIDPALPVAIHDCRECTGQVGQRFDRIEFTGLDERCDGRPVLCSGIVARKERVFPVQCNRPDGPLDGRGSRGRSYRRRQCTRDCSNPGNRRTFLKTDRDRADNNLGAANWVDTQRLRRGRLDDYVREFD